MSKKSIWLVFTAVLVFSILLAACGGAATPEATEAPEEPEQPEATEEVSEPPAAAGPSGELEIYSWWAGDEGPALEALIALYGEMYPDVE
ncbi:MAG: hypothetical protein PVF74_13185, partial [Anaerolineales bacterium]